MRKNIVHIILMCICLQTTAQTKLTVKLDKTSELKVYGSTNLVRFSLIQYGESILNKPVKLIATQKDDNFYVSENKLSIKVNNFKSNNIIAQKEFYKLMMTDKYPSLKIQLNSFKTKLTEKNQLIGDAKIAFVITSVYKEYNIPVNITIKADNIAINGKKKLSIKDFGLTPPTAMLGLIQVSEWIEIEFNIICKFTVEKN